MAKFTVESLQMWQFAPNSIHYLLSLWQRMVASVPYVKVILYYLSISLLKDVWNFHITFFQSDNCVISKVAKSEVYHSRSARSLAYSIHSVRFLSPTLLKRTAPFARYGRQPPPHGFQTFFSYLRHRSSP